MQHEYEYTIDFTQVESYSEIHGVIARSLDFSEHYGGSLDALCDLLTEQLLSGSTKIKIYGLERLRRFNNYDNRLLDILITVKHSFNNKHSNRFCVEIIGEDGRAEALPDELATKNYTLNFSNSRTEEEVVAEFVRAFEFDPKETRDFGDVWHSLLLSLGLRISVVRLLGLENLRAAGDLYDRTLKILDETVTLGDGRFCILR